MLFLQKICIMILVIQTYNNVRHYLIQLVVELINTFYNEYDLVN